jgi:hypothetical protein
MEKWLPKYLVALLLLGFVIALFVDFQTVVTIDPEAGRYEPAISEPQPSQGGRLAVGERYASLEELVEDQQAAGYLRTGTFGNHWPAAVIAIQTDEDGIRFVRKNGTPHAYTGFDGYRMQVVHLRDAGGEETIVVFRSMDQL